VREGAKKLSPRQGAQYIGSHQEGKNDSKRGKTSLQRQEVGTAASPKNRKVIRQKNSLRWGGGTALIREQMNENADHGYLLLFFFCRDRDVHRTLLAKGHCERRRVNNGTKSFRGGK